MTKLKQFFKISPKRESVAVAVTGKAEVKSSFASFAKFHSELSSGLFLRLSDHEKILFVKRLSMLVRAGIPILDGLRMLTKQATTKSAIHILESVTRDVENGQSLAAALGKFNKIFGEFAVNIIHIGELSGTLQENLNYLAEELNKKQELRRKVVGALVYPVFIMGATIAISAMLTIFIFPKILPVFASFKFDLPFTTKTLIFISTLLIHYGLYMLLGLVGLAVGFWYLMKKNEKFHFAVDRFVLKIPIFGTLAQNYLMANFCRTLGLLLKSQVLIVQAAKITANTVRNRVYQKEIREMADNITRGEKMSVHLLRKTKLFPPMVTQMVAVGENTGNLSETLIYISEMYEQEIDVLTKNLSTTIEPVLMIFMGLIVGFIAISIITPIYEITQHLNP